MGLGTTLIIVLILLAIICAIVLTHRNSDPRTYQSPRPATKIAYTTNNRHGVKLAMPTEPERGLKPHQPKIKHAPPPPIPRSMQITGRAYVIDGDTIIIKKIKIRLAGIDAPELDQPWGQKSKWEMVRICKGQIITVDLTGETSYDRLVGTCFLPDGRDIGAEIIKAGLALDGGYFSKGKYRHLEVPEFRQKISRYGTWRN
jgi:micrococcal nuclease